MSDFAVVSFNGRLGPMKFFEVGQKKTPKASFSVAINKSRRVADGQGDDGGNWIKTVAWLPCIAWGATATYLQDRGRKGMTIAGHGDWKTESYEKDGKNVSYSSVNISAVALPDANVMDGEAKAAKPQVKKQVVVEPIVDNGDEIPF